MIRRNMSILPSKIYLPLKFCNRAYFHAMHVIFTSEPDNRNKPVMMETDKTTESYSHVKYYSYVNKD